MWNLQELGCKFNKREGTECTSRKEREKKDTNSMWNLVNKLIIYDASLPAFRILEKLERINFWTQWRGKHEHHKGMSYLSIIRKWTATSCVAVSFWNWFRMVYKSNLNTWNRISVFCTHAIIALYTSALYCNFIHASTYSICINNNNDNFI